MNLISKLRLAFVLSVFAIAALNAFGQDRNYLGEKIRFGTSEEKRSALFEIRNLRTSEASRLAIPALSDADEMVRATAAMSVIFLPADEAFRALSPNLNDKSEFVRRETALALGFTKVASAVGPLASIAVRDKAPAVRGAAIYALGELGDVSGVAFLSGVLSGKPGGSRDYARRVAARSIGRIAETIQNGRTDDTTPESFLPAKYKSARTYRDLSKEFAAFGSALPVLVAVMKNPKESPDARREAAFAIGAIGNAGAIGALRSQSGSADYYLIEICNDAIRRIGVNESPQNQ